MVAPGGKKQKRDIRSRAGNPLAADPLAPMRAGGRGARWVLWGLVGAALYVGAIPIPRARRRGDEAGHARRDLDAIDCEVHMHMHVRVCARVRVRACFKPASL